MSELIGVGLGWLLGFASTAGYDWLKSRREVQRTRQAIDSELRITIGQLVAMHFALERRQNGVDQDLLGWMRPRLQYLAHQSEFDTLARALRGLADADPAQLQTLASLASEADQQTFPTIKKVSMPFLAASLEKLSTLPGTERLLGLEFAGNLERLNRDIDFAWWLHEKTLDPGAMSENSAIIQANIEATLGHISRMAARSVEMGERVRASFTT